MNPLTVAPDRLARLREICLALPDATEKEAWGDPTWRVRDRIFAMQKGNYEHGRPSLWLKAPDGAQAVLVEGDPERLFVPPYVGHKGWIGVYLDTRQMDWTLVESLVEDSYRLIAPKKLAEQHTRKSGVVVTRLIHRMPPFVKLALIERGMMAAYHSRPPYQQNDYIGWITRGKREVTREKRLEQMLSELRGGRLYMKMAWRPTAASKGSKKRRALASKKPRP